MIHHRNEKLNPTVSIHLKLAIATFVWGATPTVGRALADYSAAEILVFGRFFVASFFLYLFTLRRGNLFKKLRLKDLPIYLILGISGICLHNVLMFWGVEYADATRASIIMGFISILVALMEFFFFGIRLAAMALAGIGLGFIGVGIVVSDGDIATLLSGEIGFGDLLLLGSALAWAVYSVISRPILERIDAVDLTCIVCVIGTLMMAPFVAQDIAVAKSILSDAFAVSLIVGLGFIGTAIGYIWYYEGVNELGSMGTVMYVNLIPVTGVIIASLALGEVPTISVFIGGVLVVAGVFLVNHKNA